MENIKISVIIPVYNAEKYLKECFDSILGQTFKDFEIIVVNDGSLDNSQKIIDDYQEKYSDKFIVITQENCGQSAARNKALQYVNGKYIAYIDADDYIDYDYLETLYNEAEDNDSELVICSYDEVTNDGDIILNRNSEDWEIDFGNGLSHTFQYCACAKLYLTDMLVRNEIKFEEGEKMEDNAYGIMTNSIAKNPVALSYSGYKYRIYDDSTMGKIKQIGVSTSSKMQKFPFRGIENAINKVKLVCGDKYNEVLEFVIFKTLAGYLYVFASKSSKEDQKYVADYVERIIKQYFPKYRKNPYLKLFSLKKLPFVHRVAVVMLKWSVRLRIVYPFARVYNCLVGKKG